MVHYQPVPLDRTFAALADPSRRAILARLAARDGMAVSELAKPLTMTLPAVLKHLRVLENAGLIARAKSGRTVRCRLSPGPMEEAMRWLSHYERFWSEQLDRVAAFVEEDTCSTPPPSPASRSNAGSTLRRRKSTPPGRIRKN